MVILGAGVAIGGCGASSHDTPCPDLAQASQSIVFGTSGDSFLGLSAADIAAVVKITNGPWPAGAICTGVLVRPGWVLTGAHCLAMANPFVEIHPSPDVIHVSNIVSTIVHPTLDAALLAIEPLAQLDGSTPQHPMAVGLDTTNTDWVGQRVEIAGFGITESGRPDELRFAVESVSELADTRILVDGFGRSGACEGDSGGPMLVRGVDGRPTVGGILSAGSASCVGHDSYVRADLLVDWLASNLPAESLSPIDCGTIPESGSCLFGVALRCLDSRLVVDECGRDEVCGWDSGSAGFACVAIAVDPCQGVGSIGACADGDAAICTAGELVRTSCGRCGACVYAPTTGLPHCLQSVDSGDASSR